MTNSDFDRDQHCKDRAIDAARVADAYKRAEDALSEVGKLLRTSSISGYFGWVSEHKAAATGLRIAISKMRESVPKY